MAVSIASGVAPPTLLVLLADGQLHSGESLAQTLGQTRAAVWKGVERLRALGIEVQARARRGYCLDGPVELLDAIRMRQQLRAGSLARLRNLELLFEVDSTNTRLMAAPSPPIGSADACLCELQSSGRGRLGRRWVAPFGSGIALSMNWTFSDGARSLPALSLGVGVAVSRALKRAGAQGIGLKWPNDIWYQDRKLGGVLIEIRAEAGGPAHVVIGIGINVALPAIVRQKIESAGHPLQAQPIAAVADACSHAPSRNLIAGALLDELLAMLIDYERSGFGGLREEWMGLDRLSAREVSVYMGERSISGTARGVDHDGALLIETAGQVQRVVSGEASLRLAGSPS
jgi:BirA family transcriptional regulator, biotin operon repressor / biotin---[acetyl-CoA-carboxylase] ligase